MSAPSIQLDETFTRLGDWQSRSLCLWAECLTRRSLLANVLKAFRRVRFIRGAFRVFSGYSLFSCSIILPPSPSIHLALPPCVFPLAAFFRVFCCLRHSLGLPFADASQTLAGILWHIPFFRRLIPFSFLPGKPKP